MLTDLLVLLCLPSLRSVFTAIDHAILRGHVARRDDPQPCWLKARSARLHKDSVSVIPLKPDPKMRGADTGWDARGSDTRRALMQQQGIHALSVHAHCTAAPARSKFTQPMSLYTQSMACSKNTCMFTSVVHVLSMQYSVRVTHNVRDTLHSIILLPICQSLHTYMCGHKVQMCKQLSLICAALPVIMC